MKCSILRVCSEQPIRSFGAGEIILNEGSRTETLYVLIDGWVEICKGDVLLNKVSEPGSVFGEISALLDCPHMATVKVLAQSTFYVIPNAPEFISTNPDLLLLLSRMLAQRLTSVTSYLTGVKQSLDTLVKKETTASFAGEERSASAEGAAKNPSVVLNCGIVDKSA